jgi:hypothetical protein
LFHVVQQHVKHARENFKSYVKNKKSVLRINEMNFPHIERRGKNQSESEKAITSAKILRQEEIISMFEFTSLRFTFLFIVIFSLSFLPHIGGGVVTTSSEWFKVK